MPPDLSPHLAQNERHLRDRFARATDVIFRPFEVQTRTGSASTCWSG